MCEVCDSARKSCEYAHFQTGLKIDNHQRIKQLKFWHDFCSIINKEQQNLITFEA